VARLATLELATREPPAPAMAAALERARTLAPGRLDYAFLHARVLAAQSAFGPARNIVGPLMSSVYPEDVRASARSLMSYIVLLETSRTRRADSATAPAPALQVLSAAAEEAPAATADRETRGGPPAGSIPVYRDLGPGEQRLEGTLDRIDCESDRVVFHVRTAGGALRLTAPRMDGVEFITYRNDLRGNVACGVLATPAHVYVTSRPNADSTRTTVAIEFLPK
jgi:hypothetical protein